MCRRIIQLQTAHNGKYDKGGFILAELVIALALIAILGTMSVSFSALMRGFVNNQKADYEFLEDHAVLKQALCTWAAENDAPDSVFSVAEDGTLTVTIGYAQKAVHFADGVLMLGSKEQSYLDAIDGVTFTTNGKLIKCETYRIAKNGNQTKHSFVFSPRIGTIEEVAGNA